MEHQTATRLISETFSQPFEEVRFKNFILNFLNQIDETKAKTFTNQYVTDTFKNHVNYYKRLGTYTDPDGLKLDILVVYLSKVGALSHARTMQRNLITDFLKKHDQKDAALCAYVGIDSADWRFSFIRLDYKTEITITGKVKVKEEFTPARRYSFLVGENEPNHTARQQLLPIFENTTTNPTLAIIETAFNIESITKEFFDRYKELYLHIHDKLMTIIVSNKAVSLEFEKCKIDIAGFAKKLLGQIVFLYFLQKKGWLGVKRGENWGSGSCNYLQELFSQGKYHNYFNDVLEPLFYEALATERIDNYYEKLDCLIPFLNGGLFEPINGYDWKNVDVNIGNDCFREIFETFNLFNFTVREDEPLEKEVAVDPEMLGKVLENLLEVSDRKSKGAYYTPREIVHYMCQESLIRYLDSELNMKDEKIVPESVVQVDMFKGIPPRQKSLIITGSKIIPLDVLDFLVRQGVMASENDRAKIEGSVSYNWIMPDPVRIYAKEIDNALGEIKICDPAIGSGAFPVGLLTEIVNLRIALTSYLQPDPNRTIYNFKRHCIEESIYGVDIDSSAVDIARLRLWLSLVVDEEDFKTIKPLPNLDYKIVCGNTLDQVSPGHDWSNASYLIDKFTIETNHDKKIELKAEIDRIFKIFSRNSDKAPYHLFFQNVFQQNRGFDIVIGNPPYIQLQNFSHQPEVQKAMREAGYAVYDANGDIYCLFYEQGLNLAKKEHGILCYITSNKWMRAGYGAKLRGYFGEKEPLLLIDCGSGIFESATVDTNILLIRNCAKKSEQMKALSLNKGDIIGIAQAVQNRGISMDDLSSSPWFIGKPIEMALKKKFERVGTPLKDWRVKIYRGVLSGLSEAFIIDNVTHERLILEDSRNEEIIKPILRGRDIKRYCYEFGDLYLLQTGYDLNVPKLFPGVYRHLQQFEEKARKRQDHGKDWWNLRACTYYDEFEKEKIVWSDISTEPTFCLVDSGIYFNNTAYMICDGSKALVGVLNSNVIRWYFPQISSDLGDSGSRYFKQFVENIPIPEKSSENTFIYEKIESYVNQILVNKKDDINSNIEFLETNINALVYELYSLTKEEIAIIEEQG
jgi:hypothetical protein